MSPEGNVGSVMKKKLLILGALTAPLGIGTLSLYITHKWARYDARFGELYWIAILIGLACYLALLDNWLKRILMGIVYMIVMFCVWFLWAVTFVCSEFGTCL